MWRYWLSLVADFFDVLTPILGLALYFHWVWTKRRLDVRFTVPQQKMARAILETYAKRGTNVLSLEELRDQLGSRGLPADDITQMIPFFERQGFLVRRKKSLTKGQPAVDVIHLRTTRRQAVLQLALDRQDGGLILS